MSSSTRTWQQIEVNGKLLVPFQWRDKDYGRAEFQVCLKFKRGRVVEFWVYPVQQRLETCWHWVGSYTDFTLNSYEGLDAPQAWLWCWCKEHRVPSFSLYTPHEANYLEISSNGLSFWRTNVFERKSNV